MNLSDEQKREIYRLADIGMSQNNISAQTGINKAYVNACLRMRKALNGSAEQLSIELPVQPQSFNQVQPVNSLHEQAALTGKLFYTEKYTEDLEARNRALKDELHRKTLEFQEISTLYNDLKLKHNTIEEKHKLELEKRDLEYQRNTKSGLNGFIGADGMLGKLLDNPQVQMAIVNRLLNPGAAPMNAAPVTGLQIAHPEIADPEVSRKLNEIVQAFPVFTKAAVNDLYELIALFAQFPHLLPLTLGQIQNHLKSQQPS